MSNRAIQAPEDVDRLTTFVWDNMINRTDVYGQYNLKGKSFAEHNPLTREFLRRHIKRETVIGLYTTSPKSTSKWCCWDFDQHDESGSAVLTAEKNLQAALHLAAFLSEAAAVPLVEDSNGNGGYHVWVRFNEPAPTHRVRAWAKWFNTDAPAELYPKQDRVSAEPGPGHYGNFVRLFGKHHKRDHVSKFWCNGWLEGDEATEYLLTEWDATPVDLLPPDDDPFLNVPKAAPAAPYDAKPVGLESMATVVAEDALKATEALRRIPVEKAENYDDWVKVGMILHHIEPSGLMLAAWDSWSRKSAKYEPGACEAKWKTFQPNGHDRTVSLGTLLMWARGAALGQPPAAPPDALKRLNKILSEHNRPIEIARVFRMGVSGSTFEVEFADGKRVSLGDAAALASFTKVRAAIMD
ncbi:MAG: PriCT-2 domain-containing protein, partial [Candidatus Hydrogenedentales bacterium]